MKTTYKSVQKATVAAAKRISLKTTLSERESILIEELEKEGIKNAIAVGEKPAKGANLSIICLKTKYRINYRCGYSRYNYAPCIEISKN